MLSRFVDAWHGAPWTARGRKFKAICECLAVWVYFVGLVALVGVCGYFQ